MPKDQVIARTEIRDVIPDNRVLLIWQDPETGEEISITPDKIAKQGTPTSPTSGKEMVYSRTEVIHRDCYYCDDTGRADGGLCWECPC
jgi:folate-binding Fe-S cluster repair protein YgfZ